MIYIIVVGMYIYHFARTGFKGGFINKMFCLLMSTYSLETKEEGRGKKGPGVEKEKRMEGKTLMTYTLYHSICFSYFKN